MHPQPERALRGVGNGGDPIAFVPEHGNMRGVRPAVELLICSTKKNTARCREADTGNAVIFRSGDVWDLVPGETATVTPAKKWLWLNPSDNQGVRFMVDEVRNRVEWKP